MMRTVTKEGFTNRTKGSVTRLCGEYICVDVGMLLSLLLVAVAQWSGREFEGGRRGPEAGVQISNQCLLTAIARQFVLRSSGKPAGDYLFPCVHAFGPDWIRGLTSDSEIWRPSPKKRPVSSSGNPIKTLIAQR